MAGKEVVGLELQVQIDRREYGLNWQSELPKGGIALAWDVRLEIHLELVAA
jgi:polyisoprenoid-binding protein YceI